VLETDHCALHFNFNDKIVEALFLAGWQRGVEGSQVVSLMSTHPNGNGRL